MYEINLPFSQTIPCAEGISCFTEITIVNGNASATSTFSAPDYTYGAITFNPEGPNVLPTVFERGNQIFAIQSVFINPDRLGTFCAGIASNLDGSNSVPFNAMIAPSGLFLYNGQYF